MNDRRNPVGEWSVALAIVALVGIGALAAMLIASASSDGLLTPTPTDALLVATDLSISSNTSTSSPVSIVAQTSTVHQTPAVAIISTQSLVVLPSPQSTLVLIATFMSEVTQGEQKNTPSNPTSTAFRQTSTQEAPIPGPSPLNVTFAVVQQSTSEASSSRSRLTSTPRGIVSLTPTVTRLVPTNTAYPSPTASFTPVSPTPSPSSTPTPSATVTHTPTPSVTPTATHTASATATPSATSTASATKTFTPSPTFTPTATPTPTLTPSLTSTWTAIPTPGPIGCESENVLITSPFAGLSIRQVFAVVGTANPDDFASYAVDIRAEGSSAYRQLARGRARVTGGLLANVDPSSFGTGTFWLRLSVTTPTGNIPLEYICEIPVRFE